jgi:MIP family channel proteins
MVFIAGTATTFSSGFTETGYTGSATPNFTDNGSGDQLVQRSFEELSTMFRVNSSWGVTTALAFGFAITVLAFATSHLSGGQLNPAVTVALALTKDIALPQMAANIVAQIVGAILGSGLLYATIPNGEESTLGSNQISPGVGYGNALCGEIVMTAVLVAVVLSTAASKKNVTAKSQAPLAIGFAVFCAHAVLLPIDGCSINPARSLGPAIVSGTWPGTFWVFIVGPFLGALIAVPAHLFFISKFEEEADYADPLALDQSPGSADGLKGKGTTNIDEAV